MVGVYLGLRGDVASRGEGTSISPCSSAGGFRKEGSLGADSQRDGRVFAKQRKWEWRLGEGRARSGRALKCGEDGGASRH